MNDIDVIAAALSGDRHAVLKDQLRRIEIEIVARLAINITTREAIHHRITDLRTDLLKLAPPHDGLGDDPTTLRDRLSLKREMRLLLRELSDEHRSCWSDTQALRTEARIVEKELLQHQYRDKRRVAL